MRRLLLQPTVGFLLTVTGLTLTGGFVFSYLVMIAPWLFLPLALVTGLVLGLALVSVTMRADVTREQLLAAERHDAERENQAAQLGNDFAAGPGAPVGTILGRVLIRRDAPGHSLEGMLDVDVREKQACGHWHDTTEAGPAAFILGEVAAELRRQAMDDATPD